MYLAGMIITVFLLLYLQPIWIVSLLGMYAVLYKFFLPARIKRNKVCSCLQFSLMIAFVVVFWVKYGWGAGVFSVVCMMFTEIIIFDDQNNEKVINECVVAQLNPQDKKRWYGLDYIQISQTGKSCFSGNERVMVGSDINYGTIPNVLECEGEREINYEEWAFSFIVKIVCSIPGGEYICPPEAIKKTYADHAQCLLIAYGRKNKKQIGLGYKNIYISFPSDVLEAIAVVENTCRDQRWYTLAFVLAKENNNIEISFRHVNKKENIYQLAVHLSDVWDIRITEKYINYN
ncbi:hypothetical protein [Mixta intestinalis]|uniref:Uncharacterized protein n=1 Tax=Mixta intestinalis TaxID=1615494 RepID=A0A6P1PZS1_9GAMM|nr:hypothetical protein [Mixta intestinalis]QHM71514.1 hypothetical protein C7M51_01802 [Mixta intestinalis]